MNTTKNDNNMKKLILGLSIIVLLQPTTKAQNNLGGHFGMVHPFVTFSQGESATIADNYVVGFPTGITVKMKDRLAFDAEFVPFIDNGRMVNFMFHPGILYGLGNGLTLGNRLAFETGSQAYGFTPLLNKGFPLGNGATFFLELVLPVRFVKMTNMVGADNSIIEENVSSFTVGLHTGIAF